MGAERNNPGDPFPLFSSYILVLLYIRGRGKVSAEELFLTYSPGRRFAFSRKERGKAKKWERGGREKYSACQPRILDFLGGGGAAAPEARIKIQTSPPLFHLLFLARFNALFSACSGFANFFLKKLKIVWILVEHFWSLPLILGGKVGRSDNYSRYFRSPPLPRLVAREAK